MKFPFAREEKFSSQKIDRRLSMPTPSDGGVVKTPRSMVSVRIDAMRIPSRSVLPE